MSGREESCWVFPGHCICLHVCGGEATIRKVRVQQARLSLNDPSVQVTASKRQDSNQRSNFIQNLYRKLMCFNSRVKTVKSDVRRCFLCMLQVLSCLNLWFITLMHFHRENTSMTVFSLLFSQVVKHWSQPGRRDQRWRFSHKNFISAPSLLFLVLKLAGSI